MAAADFFKSEPLAPCPSPALTHAEQRVAGAYQHAPTAIGRTMKLHTATACPVQKWYPKRRAAAQTEPLELDREEQDQRHQQAPGMTRRKVQ